MIVAPVRFHTEVSEVHENGQVVTTEQHSRTAFRQDVRVELSEKVPDNSESITSVDVQKVESEFVVRNVTIYDINEFLKQEYEESENPIERGNQTNKIWINIAKDSRRWTLSEEKFTMTV